MLRPAGSTGSLELGTFSLSGILWCRALCKDVERKTLCFSVHGVATCRCRVGKMNARSQSSSVSFSQLLGGSSPLPQWEVEVICERVSVPSGKCCMDGMGVKIVNCLNTETGVLCKHLRMRLSVCM